MIFSINRTQKKLFGRRIVTEQQ